MIFQHTRDPYDDNMQNPSLEGEVEAATSRDSVVGRTVMGVMNRLLTSKDRCKDST